MLSKSQVKYIQSLIEKKFRKEEGVFVAEGPKIINELLQGNVFEPVALYATEAWVKTSSYAAVTIVSEDELRKISLLSTPNLVIGIFRQGLIDPNPAVAGKLSLVLDGIQDPGNLGTIIRIADWFGVENIFASEDTVDLYNPKVVQATMGSIARVQVRYIDLPEFLAAHSIPVYAATLRGAPVQSIGMLKEGFLVIGNESKGIDPALLKPSIRQVSIPSYGQAESLNAAVATGIILSHLKM